MAKARVRHPSGQEYILTQESVPALYRLAEERGLSVIRDSVEDRAASPVQAFTDAFGARMLGGISNLSEAALNAPGRAINPVLSAAFAPAMPATPGTPAARRQPSPPQIPRVTLPEGGELAAMAESPMQAAISGFSGGSWSLGDAYDARMEDRRITEADRPGMSFLGRTAADTSMLVGARYPLRGGQAGGAFDMAIARGADAARRFVNPSMAATGGGAAAGKAVGGLGVLARGAGRAVESGLEGAMIAALQDGDPATLAAVGAGSQVAGSMANTIRGLLIGEPGKATSLPKFATGVAAGAIALGALYKMIPGADGNALQWIDDNLDKILLGTAAGIAIGLAGRRGSPNPGTMGGYFPTIADALSTMPRAAILETAQLAATNADFQKAMVNAPQLNPSDSKRFIEIMESESPGESLFDWIRGNDRVRRVLTAPHPSLATIPVRED